MNKRERRLREQPFRPQATLLTGASGYLGALIAARLLGDGHPRVVMPLREGSEERLRERLGIELAARGLTLNDVRSRIHTLTWPGSEASAGSDWYDGLNDLGIDEIIHCAGCLDYFDEATLDAVNVGLTGHLLDLGRHLGVGRFIYISTAYSAGYVAHEIPEQLVPEPDEDPTYYTRSKRRAEWMVAESGLPWLVLRPSILIGEYDSGRYSGKRYGLYQQWMGLERLMTDRYHPEIHTVAPTKPLNLLHQDFFQDAFAAAHAWLPDNCVCHLTSSNGVAPTMRELWDLWLQVARPRSVRYYPSVDAVNLRAIDLRQRAYLTFAQVNLEIGAHTWHFAHDWLDLMSQTTGLALRDATLESVARCQDRFVRTSDALTRYQAKFAGSFPRYTQVHEVNTDVASVNP
jgi:dTDP-4-dehydrorhamnose reductase